MDSEYKVCFKDLDYKFQKVQDLKVVLGVSDQASQNFKSVGEMFVKMSNLMRKSDQSITSKLWKPNSKEELGSLSVETKSSASKVLAARLNMIWNNVFKSNQQVKYRCNILREVAGQRDKFECAATFPQANDQFFDSASFELNDVAFKFTEDKNARIQFQLVDIESFKVLHQVFTTLAELQAGTV